MIAIAGYSDIERIGQGGLGDVYRATRDSTGGIVAIKVLRDVSDESVAWHRTRRELTALVSLAGHANVIQLFELLDLPDGPALIMEFAPGGSVSELMQRRDGRLTVGESVLVGRHTAAALVAAHEQGIVHRDVKPQNLLIDAYGQVKLCDFGIAAMARTDEFQVRTSALSMRYASPEDLDDEVELGTASDVYSLGATLLHLARGAPPTLKERLVPWQPPATDDDELAALDAIIAACLQPDPSDRPPASAVLDDLERLGWSIDERHRALEFAPVDLEEGTDDAPTDPRNVPAAVGPDDQPTVPRPEPEHRDGAEDLSDATVYRTDRRPPPRPEPRPARRVRPLAFAGGVAVVVVLVLLVWWVSRDDRGDGTVDVQIVSRPAELAPITDLDWPIGTVGECLAQLSGQDELAAVSCAEPHDLQRFAVGRLDATRFPDGAAFARDDVQAAVRTACLDAFERFVGVAQQASGLEAPFTAPSETSFAAGDRDYQCLVGVGGSRLVGDAAAP